jgi:hypothetical protein
MLGNTESSPWFIREGSGARELAKELKDENDRLNIMLDGC